MSRRRSTSTGGRSATSRIIPGDFALSVGNPGTPAPPDWNWVALTEVARLESGHTPGRSHPEYWGGEIPWISIGDAKSHHGEHISVTSETVTQLGIDNSSARVLPAGTVCLSRTASLGYVVIMGRPMATSQDFVNWVCSAALDPRFLAHVLLAEAESLLRFSSGAVHKTIYYPEVKAFHVCLPRVEEQRRLADTLDQVLGDIDKAISNVRNNVAAADLLFENYASAFFDHARNGWLGTTLGQLCTAMEYGSSAKSKREGRTPVLRMGNIQHGKIDWSELVFTDDSAEIDKYLLKKGDVLFNRTNSPALVGKAAMYCGERPAIFAGYLIRIHFASDMIDPGFLTFYLNSAPIRAHGRTVMSYSVNQANINASKLKAYPIFLPPLREQKQIARRLRRLRDETDQLKANYAEKLTALGELRRAVLHKAFANELSAHTPRQASIVPFPQTISGISLTELHAGMLAFAYKRHEDRGKTATFGHVKAEKIAHAIEAIGGVDLGRRPVKDAAGPNDYPHFQVVRSRAKKAGYFEFKKMQTGGHRLTKYRRFDQLATRCGTVLGDRADAIRRLIDLMVPMDTEQAEIFVTVHAAWNNLLLDGRDITDEAIVREAREDWHPDKLEIPRDKFFKAIAWIRKKGLAPEGKGKRVEARRSR